MGIPKDVCNQLMTCIDGIISDLRLRWVSPRGSLITGVLRAYHNSNRFLFDVSTGPKSAGWIRGQGIKIYVEYNEKNAAMFSAPNRAYHRTVRPDGWLVCGGYFVKRDDLIVSLAHEGLHATQNIAGESLEEEVDGRLAGNAGLQALFPGKALRQQLSCKSLAASLTSIAVDYPGVAANPSYIPLGGSWPTPWRIAF